MPKFEVYKDKKGETRFRYRANNGEVMFSSEGYSVKASAMKAIASIKKNAAAAPVEEPDAAAPKAAKAAKAPAKAKAGAAKKPAAKAKAAAAPKAKAAARPKAAAKPRAASKAKAATPA
jgi:uncharacterized protein YegP (UPF0339 family)